MVDACHTAFASAFFEALVDAYIVAFASSKIGFCRVLVLLTLVVRGFHPIAMLVRLLYALVLDNSLDESLHERYNPYAFANQGPAGPFYSRNDALP